MDNNFKILSVNCQGLGDSKKRKDVFSYLRQKQCNIYCLQDTHFTPKLETYIRSEWGFDCYFNSYMSNSRGIAILFNNNFEYKVLNKYQDDKGNLLALDLTIESNRLSLVTLYGPNTDKPIFYEKVRKTLDNFGNDKIVICGDFNLVLDPDLDYDNYIHINNPNARNKLIEIIQNKGLIDIFRDLHEDKRKYTWRKRNPIKQARLDFFLISDNLLPCINNSTIEPSYRSDHNSVILQLKFNDFIKGKGLWKFNNSLLYNKDYVKLIKKKKSHFRPTDPSYFLHY